MRRKRDHELILHELGRDIVREELLTVGVKSKVKNVARKLQSFMNSHDGAVPSVFVVDAKKRLLGEVPLVSLIHAEDDTLVGELLHRVHTVHDRVSKEELVKAAVETKTDRLAIVNEHAAPVAVVHTHDLLDLAVREASGHSLRLFAGAHHDERLADGPFTAVRLRYRWLILNLATSILVVFTVTFFESTISRFVILAAYMPLVAGMGGNAGAQAVAVMVRGIALGERERLPALRLIGKELATGLMNGLLTGALMAVIAVLIGQSALLGLVLGIAIVINLLVAGIFGAGVPMTLKALGFDPALSASIFVTTATDIFGFIAFLGLAGLILL